MLNNKSNSTEFTPRKTIKILEERDKSKIKDNPPNFKSTNYIRYHNDKNGRIISKE